MARLPYQSPGSCPGCYAHLDAAAPSSAARRSSRPGASNSKDLTAHMVIDGPSSQAPGSSASSLPEFSQVIRHRVRTAESSLAKCKDFIGEESNGSGRHDSIPVIDDDRVPA